MDEDRQEVNWLSWWLIERKIMYYYEHLIKASSKKKLEVHDAEYDKNETRYLELCKKLGIPNTVAHKSHDFDDMFSEDPDAGGPGMFEVDFNRPCVWLIMRKHGINRWWDHCYVHEHVKIHLERSDDGTPFE